MPRSSLTSVALNSLLLATPTPGSPPTCFTGASEPQSIARTNILALWGVYLSDAHLISHRFAVEMSPMKC